MSDFWFPCYANDLLSSLRWKCMTPAQRGAYWQLICWQMQSDDGLLPGDLVALAALADLQLEGVLLDSFPLFEDSGKRGNPRAYREWLTRKDKTDKKREAGKKGSDIRWQKDGNTNGIPIGDANSVATVLPMHIYNQINNHMENPESPIPVQPQAIARFVPFDDFWAIWHHKKAKADANKAWAAARIDEATFALIRADLKDRKHRDPTWAKGMFMLPATYIRGKRWEDEQPGTSKPASNQDHLWAGAEN